MSYLPKIQEITNDIIETLNEDDFFVDFEIESPDYAIKRFSDELTKKFLENGLEDENESIFTEDEFDQILKEIIAEDLLRNLQKKGLLNSYEDDNTEELFFLTEKGREELENMRANDDPSGIKTLVENNKKTK
jgi:hypothetical protein